MSAIRVGLAALCALVLLGLPQDASAQILKKLKEKARERVEQRVEQRAEEGVEKGLSKAEEIVVCMVTDATCIEQAEAEGQAVQVTDTNGVPITGGAQVALPPGEGAWTNYDFVPGERVLFAEDFSLDNVGDFPRRMEFRTGSMQVVEWQGRRWLSDAGGGRLYINLPETLPERFTLEFDLAGSGNAMVLGFDGEALPRAGRITISTWNAELLSGDIHARGRLEAETNREPVRISMVADGGYVKLYANEHRVLNVPNADLGRSSRVFMFLNGGLGGTRMLTNLRIAAGGNDLYDALAADGRVATRGILFDTGSDRIRPESTPTLAEIGQMLQQHPELRLAIEGHTDNVGDDAANLTLSQLRAEAVRQYLVDRHGVAPERIVAEGHGEGRPAASNETEEGRQQNRRVELVRM